jgi:hypothetical protein
VVLAIKYLKNYETNVVLLAESNALLGQLVGGQIIPTMHLHFFSWQHFDMGAGKPAESLFDR